jgi:hypothetical protein
MPSRRADSSQLSGQVTKAFFSTSYVYGLLNPVANRNPAFPSETLSLAVLVIAQNYMHLFGTV